MNEKKTRTISDLLDDLRSDDWEIAEGASEVLVARGGTDVVDSLIPLLRSTDVRVRYWAAHVLREIGDDRAVEPLVNAINVPENCNNRGSLVYALQTLDCRNYFQFLFDLAIEGNYEVRCMVLMIFEDQEFELTPAIVAEATNKLDAFTRRKHNRPEDQDFARELQIALVNIGNKN
ncbi:MAG: HEAT repeat domain-containing protein [Planctomycetes bacterium]|nr:HEAT repeat domain-containing protein [Planctomycetota bacterium]